MLCYKLKSLYWDFESKGHVSSYGQIWVSTSKQTYQNWKHFWAFSSYQNSKASKQIKISPKNSCETKNMSIEILMKELLLVVGEKDEFEKRQKSTLKTFLRFVFSGY